MPSDPPFTASTDAVPAVESLVQSIALRPVKFVGFWAGVLAPLAYPPFLLGGLDSQSLILFVGIVLVNVVGLLVGRSYVDQA